MTSATDPVHAGSRLTSRTDPESQQIDYTYNDRNELTRIDYPGSDATTFSYNDSGARTEMVDGTGTTSYSYDNLYRLTSVTFPGSRTVSYGYDDASRRTSITYPGGSTQVTYGYDNADRLTSVTDWNSNATSYSYDDANRLTAKTLPSGSWIVSSYTYDTADRLTDIDHVKNGSTTIASVSYTLDDVGNRTQRVDDAGTHTYAYDDLYRLTSVTYPGPSTTTYAYDAFGNRTSMTKPGSQTTTYSYNDGDRITSVTPPSPASSISYTWDDNGNLTNRGSDTFSWDYEDRMTSATVSSVTTTFAYRGDGLRHSKTTGGNTTIFTWDVNAGLPVVLDDGSQYLYGAGLEAQKQSGNWYYYLGDGLGSTMAIVNASGVVQNSYTYDVYGEPTVSGSLANEFDFAGQQTDATTGLQYLRARYVDPETGTFLSREPLEVLPGWGGNPHGYGEANPVLVTDPTGLWGVSCGWCDDAANAVVDAAAAAWDVAGGPVGSAADHVQGATTALIDFALGQVGDPLVQLSLAQLLATTAAVLACGAAVGSGGVAAPACAAAVALVGYTIWAKHELIKQRYLDGTYNEAEFACMLITSAPFPVPQVVPGLSIPLCPALGAIQDSFSPSNHSGIDEKSS